MLHAFGVRRTIRLGRCLRSAASALVWLSVAGAATGCAQEPARVRDRDGVLRLTLSEYRIAPQNLRVVAAGGSVRLRILARNTGRLVHTVRLAFATPPASAAGTPAEPRFVEAAAVGNVRPGQRASSSWFVLRPGRYQLVDPLQNYANLGDYGSLVVEAPSG